VLTRLGHYAFIRRNHQHHRGNAAGTGKHVPNEERVPWHIHEADAQRRSIRRVGVQRSESEIDGDSTPLLFRQPIGINAGQRANKCCLAVIDMAGRS
jgi:hypothetical protein